MTTTTSQTHPELVSAVDDALDAYLGSDDHLTLMIRHGPSPDEIDPVL